MTAWPNVFVQRVVYLMPNVFFVITGTEPRSTGPSGGTRRRWTSPERSAGRTCTASKGTEEPRAHLVGYLSAIAIPTATCARRLTHDGMTQRCRPRMRRPV